MANLDTNLERLSVARDGIARAIRDKGGTVNNNDGFEDFIDDINSIQSGGNGLVLNIGKCKPSTIRYNNAAWETKTWTGLTNFNGNNVWTDGENIYCSNSKSSYGTTGQYVLDKSTSTWSSKTWNEHAPSYGQYVWTDGENIYYSYYENQYVLNKATSTWTDKTWNGLTNFRGEYIWTDGTNIYYSHSSDQYVLDKSTSTWSVKSWGSSYKPIYGSCVWTDGETVYYKDSNYSYYLNGNTWTNISFGSNVSFTGDQVWTDGYNIYCGVYIYDKITKKVASRAWNSTLGSSFYWTDGDNIYNSTGSSSSGNNYILTQITSKPTQSTCTPSART